MGVLVDLSGKKMGLLTVLGRGKLGKAGQPYWKCVCECGRVTEVRGDSLRSGHTVSCGCMLSAAHVTHGHAARRDGKPSREYLMWRSMLSRCTCKSSRIYHRYGGRGITVCDRWLKFENFIADIGVRPSDSHSLDRIDNNGPYSPENCRWATRREQALNTRRNVVLTVGGVSKPVSEWGEIMGLGRGVIAGRIKMGWPADKAVLTPSARSAKSSERVCL